MMTKGAFPKFESASGYGALSGSLAGAGLAGLISYLYYRKKKNQSLKSRIWKSIGWTALGGLTGGVAGSYIGRMYARHAAYKELKEKITKDLKNGEKRPGRVIYVDCIDNRHTPKDGMAKRVVDATTNGGIPTGHSMLAVIDEKDKTMSLYQVNTYDPERTKQIGVKMLAESKRPDGTIDRDQAIMGYNAIRYAKTNGTPILHKSTDEYIGNASDEDIALYIGSISRDLDFGERVVLHEGDKCDDVRLPVRFLIQSYQNTLRDGGGGYSPIPGGYNCATAAREAIDVFQKDQISHWRDMLWGGGSTANAPSFKKMWSNR